MIIRASAPALEVTAVVGEGVRLLQPPEAVLLLAAIADPFAAHGRSGLQDSYGPCRVGAERVVRYAHQNLFDRRNRQVNLVLAYLLLSLTNSWSETRTTWSPI